MKIIDRYILTTYLTRLASVFFILMFIFIIQTFWLFIDEFAGKGLDEEIILKSTTPNLDIIPSNIDLVAIELELVNHPNREFMLKEALRDVNDKYDYIIIDCAPSLGLITLNALTAADSVIIPIQCEYYALEGLGKLLNTIKSIQKIHNKSLEIEGLLLTMYDSRLRLSNQVVEEVKKHFHNMVFKTIIQRNVKLGEAPSHGKNIIDYDSTSKGAKNYINLAQELINNNNTIYDDGGVVLWKKTVNKR